MPSLYDPLFWDEEESELWDDTSEILLASYLLGTEGGIKALPAKVQVLANWDGINTAAMTFLRNYRFDWIKGITDVTRIQTQKIFEDWMTSGAPLNVLEKALESVFGEARAERIAVTETTRIFARGNMEAWENTGLVDSSTWMTAQDDLVCDICGELDGSEVGLGDIDGSPPAHVNCRCWLQPHMSNELFEKKLDEILT